MKVENLQLVKRNKTVDAVLTLLSRSQPISNETNIAGFMNHLIKSGYDIDKNHFYQLFKDLKDVEVGTFRDTNTFIWKYPFTEVCEQILFPNKNIMDDDVPVVSRKPVSKAARPGRPKGAKNRPKHTDVVFMFTTKKGDLIPLSLQDADVLVEQINVIKKKLA